MRLKKAPVRKESFREKLFRYNLKLEDIHWASGRLVRMSFIHPPLVDTDEFIHDEVRLRFYFASSQNEEEIIDTMFSRMEKAREIIGRWKNMMNAPKEVERIRNEISEMKTEIERSQEYILRNMVAIFAIFVSIFSFVLVGAKGALSIEITEFADLFKIISAMLIPIVLLLLLTFWLFVKKR